MDPAWSALVFILLAAALGWFWYDSLAARESANAAAHEACQQLALQLLDGTVAFVRLRITRGRAGHITLRRTYVFDYTANSIERRQGFLVLLGQQVESVGYAPGEQAHRQPAISVTPTAVTPTTSTTITTTVTTIIDVPATPTDPSATRPSAKVLSIEDWRRNRQRRPPTARTDDDVDDARR